MHKILDNLKNIAAIQNQKNYCWFIPYNKAYFYK